MRACLACALLWASGCKNEQNLAELHFEAIAAVTGDFDEVEATLTRLDIGNTKYEGYIDRAVYDTEVRPEAISLKAERLFQYEEDGIAEIDRYDAVFVNSGARGFGAWVYNSTAPDNSLVTDAATLEHVRAYVDNGGTLVVSDWAYDLVEAIWPDAIDFARDDAVLDDAQCGTSEAVTATVINADIQQQLLDNPTVELAYDYSYWTVVASVADDVDVHLVGDLSYRESGAVGDVELTGAPLLVSFQTEGGGLVVYSTFHWRAQRAEVTEGVLLALLDGLRPGSGGGTE